MLGCIMLGCTFENIRNTILPLLRSHRMYSKPLCVRNHCSRLLPRHYGVEILVRARFEAHTHSKSLLIFRPGSPKAFVELASKPLWARRLCSSLVRNTYALKATARACLFSARSRRSYYSILLRRRYGFEKSARACFEAPMHSK